MRRLRRGFTLVDAMIAVVIVGILAVVAIVAYRRAVHRSYLAEASQMVQGIRAAQEAFRAENGGYVNLSNGLGPPNDYPAPIPGKAKTAWGGACSTCKLAAGWSALNVASNAPLSFGYSTIADVQGVPPVPPVSPTVNGQTVSTAAMTAPWYVVEADGDIDGNGVFCKVYGFSHDSHLYIDEEGE
jgi:type II secretory pathway pseudopilin PulG